MASAKEQPLAPGHRLDGYELLWPIGEGGMASVWVARLLRKHGFEKLVAIKTILPKFASDEAFQTMFLDEARIASRIDHANVAHIHDLGENEEEGILYLVMEYVDGDALTRLRKVLVKKQLPFPIGVALRIMADVCSGLHAAHELKGVDGRPLGVVHRDVSPQNVLITTEGVSKLIDFGVAKAAGRLTEETHTGYVKGKVQYMAPEQALGRNVDRRADVWAVGAVVYHLVAGRPPFEADNQLALLNLLQRGRPPTPLPITVPTPVADVVRRALTHNQAQRFQTALEMRQAIEKTGLAASIEEVGAFVQQHLGDLAERRRQAIAGALQAAEQRAAAATMAQGSGAAASTQRIDPNDLPRFSPTSTPLTPPMGRMPPPSEPRIGPPTPQAFPAYPSSTPILAGAPPSDPRLRAASSPSFVAAPPLSHPAQTFANVVPPGSTEPLPSPEALETGADNTHPGGSLGLASISASVNTRPARAVPWLAIGGVSVASTVLAVVVGLGVRSRTTREFEPQFETPLPPASTATLAPPASPPSASLPSSPPPSASASASASPSPEPPKPEDEPEPSAKPAVAAPTIVRPVTAPTGSGKKKPRIDDGF
ncbi:MAG: protein kinase [Labilithrix sp.]|nr:protein kinase [Labilithrix sp.]MCW5815814.1 protein kinase [Labilithrix sp.]